MTDREHDIVLHGATGFVGALVAAHLAEHAPPDVRIALSGRSRDKLERARAALPAAAHGWPLIVADATDPAALAALEAPPGSSPPPSGPREVRAAAGGGLRPRRHPLRRPDRRGPVRP